jgi:hypothetical protein
VLLFVLHRSWRPRQGVSLSRTERTPAGARVRIKPFAIPPAAGASLRVNMQQAVPGGAGDQALAYGFNNQNLIVGTPNCVLGQPGCTICEAWDSDNGPGSEDYAPAGSCTNAKKHKLYLTF